MIHDDTWFMKNMDELIKTFHIDWKLLIAQLVNFGIVLWVLYKFAIKPLSKTMDARTEEIEKSLEDAKKIEASLAQTETERQDKLDAAKKDAQEIIEKARQQGERQGKTMVDDAKREVQTVIAAAKEQIAQEKQSMLRELKAEVGTLVVKATAKVLEKVTTKEVDERLIEESLKEVKRQ